MQINTLKRLQNGYQVNGAIFAPNDPNNSDYQKIQKWLANGGVFEEELKETTEQKKSRIKNELIISRQSFLDKTFREAVEHLLNESDYQNKESREKAKKEIKEIKQINTLKELNSINLDFVSGDGVDMDGQD